MYRSEFYKQMHESSISSVEVILDQLLRYIPLPNSIVDVGAGVGSWLKGIKERGCHRILAIEGEWVEAAVVQIPRECYYLHDLEKPLRMAERFDLAISLEVAEHLTESRGCSFVEDLTRLSDAVVFSAAIPGQGGAHHLNEQWQQYWVSLFESKGFAYFDIIRPLIWDNKSVRVEYRQNILFFVKKEIVENFDLPRNQPLIANVMHPSVSQNWGPGIKLASRFLWKAILRRLCI